MSSGLLVASQTHFAPLVSLYEIAKKKTLKVEEPETLRSTSGSPEAKRKKVEIALEESKLYRQINGYLLYFQMLDRQIDSVCSRQEESNTDLKNLQKLKRNLGIFLEQIQTLFY